MRVPEKELGLKHIKHIVPRRSWITHIGQRRSCTRRTSLKSLDLGRAPYLLYGVTSINPAPLEHTSGTIEATQKNHTIPEFSISVAFLELYRSTFYDLFDA